VLNHFAVPEGAAGGTRHIEMFGALEDRWDVRIIAADRNLLDRRKMTSPDPRFRFVPTTPYRDNGPARIANWMSYTVGAVALGLFGARPAVVYASSPHLLAGLAGWMIARLRRAGFILEVRDLWPQILIQMGRARNGSVTYRILERIERRLYRSADAIVVLAQGSEPRIRAMAGPGVKVVLVPNGADTDRFLDVHPDLGAEPMTFIYAGAHGPANGLHLLLDAAKELEAESWTGQIVLVGDGVDKHALKDRAEALGLRQVAFRDSIPKVDMAGVLGSSQVGLHVLADVPMFRHGVSPNKLFEYMAAGLPVITNTPGEVSGVVTEAAAGIACEPHDMAGAMRRMAALPLSERQAMGASGREWVGLHRSRRVLAETIDHLMVSVTHPGGS
jgi:glycosyltransferase involved in cell wall biosynthesis